MSTSSPIRGRRVVVGVYLIITVIAGVMGAILGAARPDVVEPELFGVIALPPTALGMAIYGMVTIGLGLGVLLVAVSYVADRFDTRDPGK
ncbi:hypothetical protein [Halorhabdus sp. SVX81]|uniref:DUF7520 family protein n=1 Tax=Halorhabdus sp. SVX81 TaxID=2978283 RepID=UPI0023DC90E5|nr:hypothetical protein [Halorhabdus sp. SVX81]